MFVSWIFIQSPRKKSAHDSMNEKFEQMKKEKKIEEISINKNIISCRLPVFAHFVIVLLLNAIGFIT